MPAFTIGPADDDTPEADRAGEAPEEDLEFIPPGWHGRRALFGWLLTGALLALVALTVIVAGRELYNPASRIPETHSPTEPGLLGTTRPVMTELQPALAPLMASAGRLDLAGDVYELEFPRTIADRLFGKRKERATIFVAKTDTGTELRILALRDASETLFAVEPPTRRRAASPVEGIFFGLPLNEPGSTDALVASLTALLAAADKTDAKQLSSDAYTIFGPYGRGDSVSLQRRIEGNVVLTHLTRTLAAADADVSLAASVFLVREAPERGVIRALYQSQLRIVQEPLWGISDTSTLAHELTHAYVSRVLPDASAVLRSFAGYLDTAHPRLYGGVVGDLYERLDREGQAEEALAFITGSVAAGDTKTVAPARLLQNQGLLDITEAILRTDIEFLIRHGLLPACMDPTRLGLTEAEVSFAYYDAVEEACS
jgi:hypothetical protein